MKNSEMIRLVSVAIACVLSGCVSDVSDQFPHSQLIGTSWKLNDNMYTVKNFSGSRGQLLVPCKDEFDVYIPHMKWEFDLERIGESGEGEKITGAALKGSVYRIIRVLKEKNLEMGDSFYPIAVPVDENRWIGKEEVNLYLLYRDFVTTGRLNPKYAEKVSIETNSPPRAQRIPAALNQERGHPLEVPVKHKIPLRSAD